MGSEMALSCFKPCGTLKALQGRGGGGFVSGATLPRFDSHAAQNMFCLWCGVIEKYHPSHRHIRVHKRSTYLPSFTGRSAAIQNVFIFRVIASDWTVKYRHLLSVPWKISTKAIRQIDQCTGRLKDGKVSGSDITHTGGDFVSGALILKRINNSDRLWTRREIDISDKTTQVQAIKSYEIDSRPKKQDSNKVLSYLINPRQLSLTFCTIHLSISIRRCTWSPSYECTQNKSSLLHLSVGDVYIFVSFGAVF